MNSPWISQLGNWNPQLLREFRGRLRPRSFIAAIALSLIAQALTLLIFFQIYPKPSASNWYSLWSGLFFLLPYILICIGGYYLVNNLTQEEKSGTLNFIRLSPRPAWQILLGKLIGVPVLPVIAVGLILPLHLIVTVLARVPLLMALSYYLMLGVGCLLFWSLAILFGLVGSHRPGLAGQANTLSISYAAISLVVLVPLWSSWNSLITWFSINPNRNTSTPWSLATVEWCWVPINRNVVIAHGFTLLNCGIILFFLWRILLRRFRRPRATLLSRRQSYGVMAYLLVLALGFFLNSEILSASGDELWDYGAANFFQASALGIMMILTYILTLLLMGAICPQRQALMEWSRQPQQGLMGLIWADKSPAVFSFGILLVIANLILVPLALLFPTSNETEINTTLAYLIMILGLSSTLLLIGTFMQFIFIMKLRNPSVWFLGSLLLWWVVPPIVLGIVGSSVENISVTAIIWSFLGYPVAHWADPANLPLVLFGIFGQWAVIGFLFNTIQRLLHEFKQVGSLPSSVI